jgi:hypothetical protein
MPWVTVYVGLAVGGLAVLGVAGFRLWGDVRTLGREVAAASQRLAEAASELEAASARSLPTGSRPRAGREDGR